MKENQKILLALFAGVAAGAAAAILLTTEEGKETRSKIGDWADGMINTSKDKLNNLKSGKPVEENEETTLGI